MTGFVLLFSGVFLVVVGIWRGYLAARSAVLPFVAAGPAAPLLVAASPSDRSRVRWTVRQVGFALIWLGIAMYGLYLATAAASVHA